MFNFYNFVRCTYLCIDFGRVTLTVILTDFLSSEAETCVTLCNIPGSSLTPDSTRLSVASRVVSMIRFSYDCQRSQQGRLDPWLFTMVDEGIGKFRTLENCFKLIPEDAN